jgi:hypothetical protein
LLILAKVEVHDVVRMRHGVACFRVGAAESESGGCAVRDDWQSPGEEAFALGDAATVWFGEPPDHVTRKAPVTHIQALCAMVRKLLR